jgi:hypothetical protein|nr:MAG TPA: hypothetical protein [Caudoviricetes sp.]
MHIYIRTGDNENTGIEFLNGKGWSEPHIEQKGFIFTPKNAPARKYEFKGGVNLDSGVWGTKNEKSLAALVLLSEELSKVPENETVESVTWIMVGIRDVTGLDLLKRYELGNPKGNTAEELNGEVKYIIYKYLNEGPTHVRVSITDEDRKRITYDNNGTRDGFGYMRKDLPQGFSIVFDDTVEHYSVPEFLRRAVFSLTDEQETLAETILLADKLSKLEQSELVTTTVMCHTGEIEEPTPAVEVLERLQHFICAYTVNDDSKIIGLDGDKAKAEAKVRKANVTVEVLKRVDFYGAPGLSEKPEKLSDFDHVRAMHNVGFVITGTLGRCWVFKVKGNGSRSTVYGMNYEDRALAVAALATFSVADKHQYYGELQIVSDVLEPDFVEAVNDILRGLDYYELVSYLKGFFNVEEVRR